VVRKWETNKACSGGVYAVTQSLPRMCRSIYAGSGAKEETTTISPEVSTGKDWQAATDRDGCDSSCKALEPELWAVIVGNTIAIAISVLKTKWGIRFRSNCSAKRKPFGDVDLHAGLIGAP